MEENNIYKFKNTLLTGVEVEARLLRNILNAETPSTDDISGGKHTWILKCGTSKDIDTNK